MSEELRDVRFKVTNETLVILTAMADADSRDLSVFLRRLCESEVSKFIHAASLADRKLRGQGESGILRDK
jgi:hypothetical protein